MSFSHNIFIVNKKITQSIANLKRTILLDQQIKLLHTLIALTVVTDVNPMRNIKIAMPSVTHVLRGCNLGHASVIPDDKLSIVAI